MLCSQRLVPIPCISAAFSRGSIDSDNIPGFPMSQFLKPFQLQISRNATMVAQQVQITLNTWFLKFTILLLFKEIISDY